MLVFRWVTHVRPEARLAALGAAALVALLELRRFAELSESRLYVERGLDVPIAYLIATGRSHHGVRLENRRLARAVRTSLAWSVWMLGNRSITSAVEA